MENIICTNKENYSKLSKEDKKKIKKERYRLEKLLRKHTPHEVYSNNSVTQFGNYSKVIAFKKLIGVSDILSSIITDESAPNSRYTLAAIIDFCIDANILGVSRFSHMDCFLYDNGFKKLRDTDNFPTERTIREAFYKAQDTIITQLERVNSEILIAKSNTEKPRNIWLDVDSSVLTVWGHQEGAEIGCNSKFKGRPCLQIKIAFIADTDEILRIELHNGRSVSNTNHLEFLTELEKSVPSNWVVQGIRTDRGYFSEENLEWYEYEKRCWNYVCKAKQTTSVKAIIDYLTKTNQWTKEDSIYSSSEITVPLKTWAHARRFVFIRENISEKKLRTTGQVYIEETAEYSYSVIVTSLTDLAPMDVWRFYNKRGTCENKIDELKSGFSVRENSQHSMKCNKCSCLIKTIAYNIINWFRQSILPEELKTAEIPTIRRKVLNVSANVKGEGRFMTSNFQNNEWLKKINQNILINLKKFINTIITSKNNLGARTLAQ